MQGIRLLSSVVRASSVTRWLVVLALLLQSCRTCELPPSTKAIKFERGSVVLATVRTRNEHRIDNRLVVTSLKFRQVSPTGQTTTRQALVGGQPWTTDGDSGRVGWYAAQLPPGRHRLIQIAGRGEMLLAPGHFEWPVDHEFELAPETVLDLGEFVLVNRTRTGDEERSGGIFPLIDQAVSGFAASTIDLLLQPPGESAGAEHRRHYKALSALSVSPHVALPAPPEAP